MATARRRLNISHFDSSSSGGLKSSINGSLKLLGSLANEAKNLRRQIIELKVSSKECAVKLAHPATCAHPFDNPDGTLKPFSDVNATTRLPISIPLTCSNMVVPLENAAELIGGLNFSEIISNGQVIVDNLSRWLERGGGQLQRAASIFIQNINDLQQRIEKLTKPIVDRCNAAIESLKQPSDAANQTNSLQEKLQAIVSDPNSLGKFRDLAGSLQQRSAALQQRIDGIVIKSEGPQIRVSDEEGTVTVISPTMESTNVKVLKESPCIKLLRSKLASTQPPYPKDTMVTSILDTLRATNKSQRVSLGFLRKLYGDNQLTLEDFYERDGQVMRVLDITRHDLARNSLYSQFRDVLIEYYEQHCLNP